VVAAQRVLAGRAVATGILHTLFDVHLACLALEGWEGGRQSKMSPLLLHVDNRMRYEEH